MLRSIILILTWTIVTPLFSQLKHITTDDGLPSNRVYGITVDSKGFLWCTTDRGIAMYDGDRFTTFTTENGMPINDIYKIIPTPDGKMWYFGKSSQLGYIQNGIIRKFSCVDSSIMGATTFIVMGNHVGFYHNQCSYYLHNDRWVKMKVEEKFRQGPHRRLPLAWGNAFRNVLITMNGKELIHYTNECRVVKKFQINEPGWDGRNWHQAGFYENMFCFMNANHIYTYDYVKHHMTVLDGQELTGTKNYIHSTFFMEGNKVGITNYTGKYIIEGDKLIPSFRSKNSFFQEKMNVMGVYADRGGSIWANTGNAGIYKLPLSVNTPILLKDKPIQKIEIFQGDLVAAVEDEGLYRIDPAFNKTPEELYINLGEPLDHYYYQLINHNDTALEVLTSRYHFNYNNGSILDLRFLVAEDLKGQGGKAALFKADTLLVLSSSDVWVVDRRKNCLIRRIPFVAGYAILNYDHQILIGSNNGLFEYKDQEVRSTGLLNNVPIKNLIVWKNRMIIGTDGMGVYYFYSGKPTKINYLDKLVVNELYVDDQDRLWVSSNFGAHQVTYSQSAIAIKSILASHGLISNQVNGVRCINDRTYFATDKGLCALKLDSIKFNLNPTISIRKVVLNDSVYDPSQTKISILSKGDNQFSLNFDISFLGEHEQLKKYYKIEPIHSKWMEINTTEINYQGLSPGKYKVNLKVIGFNNNIDTDEINFVIEPRWYELSWVRNIIAIFAMLIFVIVVLLISRVINRNIRRRYHLKKKMVEIELDALRSKLNPHFIFNTLNSIQFYINQNDMESSEKYLVLFSNHIRDIFEYSHYKKISLDKEIQLISDYLKLEMMRFEGKISYRINIDPTIALDTTFIPSMLLQPFVENAIKHGLLHKKTGAELVIDFRYVDPSTYLVSIIDNGKGFEKKDMFRKSSTALIDERIHLLNESGEWNIKKEIENFNEYLDDRGTIISLTIQYKA